MDKWIVGLIDGVDGRIDARVDGWMKSKRE